MEDNTKASQKINYKPGNGVKITDEGISVDPESIPGMPKVVQKIGQSTSDVMSQKAVTDMVYIGDTKQNIAIGMLPTVSDLSGSNIVIGRETQSYGSRDVAIGYRAKASKEEGFRDGGGIAIGSDSYSSNPSSLSIGLRAITKGLSNGIGSNVAIGMDAVADPINASDNYSVVYSVALGAYSKPTRRGEINVGTGGRNLGFVYNQSSTDYRVIGGVHDGVEDHDVVTVGQMNTKIGDIETILEALTTGNGV